MVVYSTGIILFLLVASAGAVCLYHIGLAVTGLVMRTGTRRSGDSSYGSHRFAILIPAHNEEAGIEDTLHSCQALDYPKEHYAVYVVADNCTDATANVAARHGAVCLVRNDEERRGKGFALEWAFPQVLREGWDAVVVLDADCSIDAHALRVFGERLAAGDRVLQAMYSVSNPDDCPVSYMLALANRLENDLFYAPKSALGLAVFLRGTGMVFHRDVLACVPWKARSIVEDAECTSRLLREGISVRFVPEVRVLSAFPNQGGQLRVQRERWIGGTLHLSRDEGLRLFWQGLIHRRIPWIDAGWTTLIVSRPLILLHLLATVLSCVVYWRFVPGAFSRGLLISSLVMVGAYVLYAAVGALRLGVTLARVRLLFCSPWIVVRYVLFSAKTVLLCDAKTWERTPRSGKLG